jgi:hypothetical protein
MEEAQRNCDSVLLLMNLSVAHNIFWLLPMLPRPDDQVNKHVSVQTVCMQRQNSREDVDHHTLTSHRIETATPRKQMGRFTAGWRLARTMASASWSWIPPPTASVFAAGGGRRQGHDPVYSFFFLLLATLTHTAGSRGRDSMIYRAAHRFLRIVIVRPHGARHNSKSIYCTVCANHEAEVAHLIYFK